MFLPLHIMLSATSENLDIENMPVYATDAVPVYPSCSTGKILVPWHLLDERQRRSYLKRHGMVVPHL